MCLAIPGRVEEIIPEGDLLIGRINFGGILKRVCLDYVPEIQVGDYAIVHVGFAITRVDAESAEKTLEVFRQMGALQEELATEDETLARMAVKTSSPALTAVAQQISLKGMVPEGPSNPGFGNPIPSMRLGFARFGKSRTRPGLSSTPQGNNSEGSGV